VSAGLTWQLWIMGFGARLAALRKERSLTQAALADQVGCHITMIRRYEAGETQPTLEIIRKLSIALTVSADTLVFGEGGRKPADDLLPQFEAIGQFTPEEKAVAKVLLDSLILQHMANRFSGNSKPSGRSAA
jgi:transcriptional regulator with XRE-family HTH domain